MRGAGTCMREGRVGRMSAVKGMGWEYVRKNVAASVMASARGAGWDSSAWKNGG